MTNLCQNKQSQAGDSLSCREREIWLSWQMLQHPCSSTSEICMLYAELLLQAALPVIRMCFNLCYCEEQWRCWGLGVLVAINKCRMEAGFAIRGWRKQMLRRCTGCMHGVSFALSMSSHCAVNVQSLSCGGKKCAALGMYCSNPKC
jgi:hypothetical protein